MAKKPNGTPPQPNVLAAEFWAALEADPAYQKLRARKDRLQHALVCLRLQWCDRKRRLASAEQLVQDVLRDLAAIEARGHRLRQVLEQLGPEIEELMEAAIARVTQNNVG